MFTHALLLGVGCAAPGKGVPRRPFLHRGHSAGFYKSCSGKAIFLWPKCRKLVPLSSWPLWTPVSQLSSRECIVFCDPCVRLGARTGPSLACAEGLSPRTSHFSSVPQICVLQAKLISRGSTQENGKMAVRPRSVRKQVGIN